VEFVAICLISRKATKDCAVGTHRVYQKNKKMALRLRSATGTAEAQKQKKWHP
jgi:hypothetical protein